MSDRTDWADSQGAIIVSWTGIVRGREGKAFEVFGKAAQYYTELEKDGTLTGTQVYFGSTGGSRGQIILSGRLGDLYALMQRNDFTKLQVEGGLVAEGFEVNTAIGGGFDAVAEGMAVNLGILQEHGLM